MDASNVASRFQNARISRSITGKLGDAGMWGLDAFAPLTGAASSGAVDSAAAAGPGGEGLSSNVPSPGGRGHTLAPCDVGVVWQPCRHEDGVPVPVTPRYPLACPGIDRKS